MIKSFAILGLAAVVASAGSAHAASTTFSFDGGDMGQTSLTKFVDGIKLTLNSFAAGPNSAADQDGLAIFCINISPGWTPCTHGGTPQDYTSFQMIFDQPVQLLSYNVSYEDNSSGSSTSYSQGALQSVQSNGALGLISFSNPFIAAANVPILVSSTALSPDSILQINAFTVEKMPTASVPGPLPLAGAATAFSLSRQLRRRLRQSSGV